MKQIITILIIVAALAGAGVFGYMMFTGSGAETAAVTPVTNSQILPRGSKLNFEQVKKFNKDERLYQYPKVDTSEIGPVMGTIIKQ